MVKIAIMGHGVVGSGVAEVLYKNKEIISARTGFPIELVRLLDVREFSKTSYSELFTKNFSDILEDDSISVVVETMGGLNPSAEFTRKLLQKGKSVVTSNKALVAEKGDEFLRIARENNVNYLFEASVGGGIPIIRPLHQCLAANRIEWIQGILNGTTNFIMTKMIEENMGFDDALKLAQSLGYAERNPSDDVDGADANRKICILASLAYGKHVYPKEVHQYGIRDVALADVAYACSMKGVIKLIARAKLLDSGKISVMVCPAVISKNSKLAAINGVDNAILVKGDVVGEVLFVGAGAGKMPTASAVLGDVINAAKAHHTSVSQTWESSLESVVSNYRQDSIKFYFRVSAQDVTTAQTFITKYYKNPVFLTRSDQPKQELAFYTGAMLEQEVKELAKKAKQEGIEQLSKIRVLI